MTWLAPDAWLPACGAPADGLCDPYVPLGGEDALWHALEADPRRLTFIIGRGSSRVALELAHRATVAFYPDPVLAPAPHAAVSELAVRLTRVPHSTRPVVVLDGPNRVETFAFASALLTQSIHPRLLVLVPGTIDEARWLLRLAGTAMANARVVLLPEDAAYSPPPAGLPIDALLPFALAGRRASDRAPAGAELRERRLVVDDQRSRTTLCLLPDRTRHVVLAHGLMFATDGPTRLRALLADDPAIRPYAALALLQFADASTFADLEPALFDVAAPALLHVLDYLRDTAAWMPPPVAKRLASRADALTARDSDPAHAAALARYVALHERVDGNIDGAIARLRAWDERELHDCVRGPLLETLADMTQDADAYDRALAVYRKGQDVDGLRRVLPALIRVLEIAGDRARADELLAELAGVGDPARVTSISLELDRAQGRGELEHAIVHAGRLLAELRARGDYRGQVVTLHRRAMLRRGNDLAGAEADVREALQLERAADNARGEMWCHRVLARLAEEREEPEQALVHYTLALTEHEAQGLPTGLLREAIVRTRQAMRSRGRP
jgi:tetratricopeptide (TPR) repeat protein